MNWTVNFVFIFEFRDFLIDQKSVYNSQSVEYREALGLSSGGAAGDEEGVSVGIEMPRELISYSFLVSALGRRE